MKLMMHLWVLLAFASLFSTNALAKRRYGMAGCGLGSVLFGDSGGQIFGATTNATGVGVFDTQNLGITFGTSNCLPDEDEVALFEQEKFVLGNLASLSKEMAQGNGEVLTAYSDVLGCNREVFAQFASHLQHSYERIFSAPGAMAMLDATREELQQHEDLAQACSRIN